MAKPSSTSRSRPAGVRRATYHHGDLRKALVEAALALIAEHGVEGFTLRDCARKAGVSVAAPYRHFTDRDDLLAAVAADCMQRLGLAMDRAVEAAGTDDPLAVFRATGIAYVRFAVEHPAHFRVMNMPQVVARTPPEVREQVDAWGRDMAGKLRAAQEAGSLARLPLADIMLAASCITHGLAHMIVDGVHGFDELDPDSAAALATAVTGVIGYGFLPRTGADAAFAAAAAAAAPPSSAKPTPKSTPKPTPKSTPKSKRAARGAGAGAIVLAAMGLAAGRADAKGAALQVAGATYRAPAPADAKRVVLVDDLPAAPAAGAYLLVGAKGPVGALALDRSQPRRGACPYHAELHLVDAPLWQPGADDELVVIGPVDPGRPAAAQLVTIGKGKGPSHVDPTYAIDLDGDGAADLVVDRAAHRGPFVRGFAKIDNHVTLWQRRGKRWSSIARCSWTDTDAID